MAEPRAAADVIVSVYYNENDPYAALWLLRLMAAGHLPHGYVDQRSIEEVSPDDVKGFDQVHFFAGIGGWPLALKWAGWEGPVWTGSCPCQPFSVAGLGSMDQLTLDICGPPGSGSSESAALSRSLASRCRELLGTVGSTLFRQIWRQKATPLGRLYWAHTASGLRTSGSGSGGWPTPMAADDNQSRRSYEGMMREIDREGRGSSLAVTAYMAVGWTTPQAHDAQGSPNPGRLERHGTKHGCRNLNDEVGLAGWTTPTASAKKRSDSHRKGREMAPQEFAGWGTPRASDADKNVTSTAGALREAARKGANNDLGTAAHLSGWATPTGRDHKDGPFDPDGATPVNSLLGREVSLSGAQTEPRGQLNPEFTLWLMGFPAEWASCAPQATPSSRKSRPSS